MPAIELAPAELAIVLTILRRHVPDREVWAFGSRVGGTPKKFSDLDLAILGEAPLPLDVESRLAEDFDESNLPFKVDVVDWAVTSNSFRMIITRQHAVLQLPSGGHREQTGKSRLS